MKKICLAIILVLIVCALASCDFSVESEPRHEHTWVDATCESPRTCSKCGLTKGSALDHSFVAADCFSPKTCSACGLTVGAKKEHSYSVLDMNETHHWYKCSACGTPDEESKAEHEGGEANCTHKAACDICDAAYGEIASDVHGYAIVYTWADDYSTVSAYGDCIYCDSAISETVEVVYLDGIATATFENEIFEAVSSISVINGVDLTPEELNALVVAALEEGELDLYITLESTPVAEKFTAIRRAFVDVKGLANGSIDLTLAGVTVIPDHSTNPEDIGTAIFGRIVANVDYTDNSVIGRTVTAEENVLDLGSISLPDVISIGEFAFYHCDYLTSVSAPKVQVIGADAFAYTGLVSVEFPEATTIGTFGFSACTQLTSVKLPKATLIESRAFLGCSKLTSVVLSAEGTITLGTSVFGASEQCLADSIDLVLNVNKQNDVVDNTWNGYTFNSVQFPCVDGTNGHNV